MSDNRLIDVHAHFYTAKSERGDWRDRQRVASGAKLWVGTMPETGVGAQAALAVAAHAGCVCPTDLEPSDRWYEPGVDIVELQMTDAGTMRVPDRGPEILTAGRATLLFELGESASFAS